MSFGGFVRVSSAAPYMLGTLVLVAALALTRCDRPVPTPNIDRVSLPDRSAYDVSVAGAPQDFHNWLVALPPDTRLTAEGATQDVRPTEAGDEVIADLRSAQGERIGTVTYTAHAEGEMTRVRVA